MTVTASDTGHISIKSLNMEHVVNHDLRAWAEMTFKDAKRPAEY